MTQICPKVAKIPKYPDFLCFFNASFVKIWISMLETFNKERVRCLVVFYEEISAVLWKNKPRTSKVGAISKAQNCKRGPFDVKNSQNFFNVLFEQCQSAEKCKRGDPLGFFDIHCVAKYRNKWRSNPKNFKKSRIVPKKVGLMWILSVFSRFDVLGVFCFFFFSFWTRFWGSSVLNLHSSSCWTNEQKSGPYASKKTTHCKSRAHFLLKCAN